MTLKVCAIDPGPHVGLALREEDGSADVWMIERDLNRVMEAVMDFHPDVIAVELFATGGRMSKYGIETIEIVGAMQALAHVLGAKFYKRAPQIRYSFMDQARKELKIKGRTQHHIDAYAHLLSVEYHEGPDYA